jgi:hypothetical protein
MQSVVVGNAVVTPPAPLLLVYATATRRYNGVVYWLGDVFEVEASYRR